MVTASIVTYKTRKEILSKAIESFLKASNGRLYVIDNSPDDDARKLCNYSQVEYIKTTTNLGYGRAHNLALKKVLQSSEYHLILNPDVYFEPDAVSKLTSFLDENERVGLVMPKVLYPDGRLQPLCKLLPVPHHLLARRFMNKMKYIYEHINQEYEMAFTGYDHVTEVPFLSGCFMLVRTEALKKVGLFDERFFMYFEDTDLSRRINTHYQTLYYPDVEIFHYHERGHYKEQRLLWCGMKSAVKYFNKWGWYSDPDRNSVNKKILMRYHVNGYSKKFKS